MAKVLIVDDEVDIQSTLSLALKDEGYDVQTATLPGEALEILNNNSFDLALYDIWFPEGDGISLLKKTLSLYPHMSVVMMSGHANIELALKSIRVGAYDFLEKPLELEKVLVVLKNAHEKKSLKEENEWLKKQIRPLSGISGHSEVVTRLKEQAYQAALNHSFVFIEGENGTGKELVARMVFDHYSQSRSAIKFLSLNCAAIPESLFESELFGHEKGAFTGADKKYIGKFEEAGAGVLFLDEIADLSPMLQSKFLRVLEEKTFRRVGGKEDIPLRAKLIFATNKSLAQEVKEGRFRQDLFYRINVLKINVPPLRERQADIPELAQEFVNMICLANNLNKKQIDSELMSWMSHYDWPGNVRELKHMIERMLVMGNLHKGVLDLKDLPEEYPVMATMTAESSSPNRYELNEFRDDPSMTLRQMRSMLEKSLLKQRLERMDGNVTKTAESLGIERAHLHRKLKQFQISRREGEKFS